jgi:hypothetical protein
LGNAGVFATNLDARAAPHLYPNDVVQSNGLIDGTQIVKAVWPQPANAKAQVDFGEGSDGDGHG